MSLDEDLLCEALAVPWIISCSEDRGFGFLTNHSASVDRIKFPASVRPKRVRQRR
jgi:hypothetical protein